MLALMSHLASHPHRHLTMLATLHRTSHRLAMLLALIFVRLCFFMLAARCFLLPPHLVACGLTDLPIIFRFLARSSPIAHISQATCVANWVSIVQLLQIIEQHNYI